MSEKDTNKQVANGNAGLKPTPAQKPADKPAQVKETPVITIHGKPIQSENNPVRRRTTRDFRRNLLAISFVMCVLIPTILGALYFTFIASDRYTASAGFSVRSMDAGAAGSDILGTLTGLASVGSTTTDSYIILEYLESRELVERLSADFPLEEAFGNSNIDWFYRLAPNMPVEDLVDHWHWMISASYDNSSEIINFEVQAFSVEDAKTIADLVLHYSQELINRLSADARSDAVKFAKREVTSAELRLKGLREKLREFRAQSSAVDPSATAAAQLEIVTRLENELITVRSQLATLLASASENSPRVQPLRDQIASLQKSLHEKKAEVGGFELSEANNASNLSGLLAGFEELKVEQEFAQQAYTVALSSLERARAEADRQQRFLAIFKHPQVPEDAKYPHRLLNSFLVLLFSFIIWGIGALLVYSIRDHLR
ncbi:MAG: hypothetical protein JJ858_18330 [Rhizobiaceae bacterium]|nr:hypothetical protein [Rhizobiaceae bacterium]